MGIKSLDLSALAAAFAAGLTPAELVDHVYARLAAVDDPGIFITLRSPEAVLADYAALGRYDPAKPLWGVPFAVKDNIDVAGLPTTVACKEFAYQPAATAESVARLERAGAVVIGKVNLDQFATGLVGVRTPYPAPRNAVDPTLVPGGSSSGSGVVVAQGIVSFALGTDTAGSGRVPAALNNIVGLKPSCGLVSTRGVFPACRSLDCVTVFAATVDDAYTVLEQCAGYDPEDPFSRRLPFGPPVAPPAPRIGIPSLASEHFLGHGIAAAAFRTALENPAFADASFVEVDMAPFAETAQLLYDGPWVGERYQSVRAFMETQADCLHPVTRRIIESARSYSAADAFAGLHRLAELKRQVAAVWAEIDILAVPTIPGIVTLAEVVADPLKWNSELGTYTNFTNLLDLAALAVPGPFRSDGRPAGITLMAPAGQDARLAGFGALFHAATGLAIGATGVPVPPPKPRKAASDLIEIVVVGAHLSGMPLNREITALGGVFVRAVATAPLYRLYALPGGPPHRPGLVRVSDGSGSRIATEIWALPPDGFGRFVAGVPAPLCIGTLALADGTTAKGFLCESDGLRGAADISHHGGWRPFVADMEQTA